MNMFKSKYYICWVLVCHFLEYDTILSLENVDPIFKTLLKNSLIWKHTRATINLNFNDCMPSYIDDLKKYINVSSLNIFIDKNFSKETHIFNFLKKLNNLNSIQLNAYFSKSSTFFKHFDFSKLKHLILVFNYGSSNQLLFHNFQAPLLESLEIKSKDCLINLKYINLPRLKSLIIPNLNNYESLEENNIEKLNITNVLDNEFFNHIHKFKILNTLNITVKGVEDNLCDFLNSLETLHLTIIYPHFNIKRFSAYFSKFKNLKNLYLCVNERSLEIDCETFENFKYLSHLDTLNINQSKNGCILYDYFYIKLKTDNLIEKMFEFQKKIKHCKIHFHYEDYCLYKYGLPRLRTYEKLTYIEIYEKYKEFSEFYKNIPKDNRSRYLYEYDYFFGKMCENSFDNYTIKLTKDLNELKSKCYNLAVLDRY